MTENQNRRDMQKAGAASRDKYNGKQKTVPWLCILFFVKVCIINTSYHWHRAIRASLSQQIIAGLNGRDVIRRYPGIGFLMDYNSYFDNRTKQLQTASQQGLQAFHE